MLHTFSLPLQQEWLSSCSIDRLNHSGNQITIFKPTLNLHHLRKRFLTQPSGSRRQTGGGLQTLVMTQNGPYMSIYGPYMTIYGPYMAIYGPYTGMYGPYMAIYGPYMAFLTTFYLNMFAEEHFICLGSETSKLQKSHHFFIIYCRHRYDPAYFRRHFL